MHHPHIQEFIDYWRDLRQGRRIPARADLSPTDFRHFLPRVFLLRREGLMETISLAGGVVSDLHGRELRGTGFLSLWRPIARPAVRQALNQARDRAAPVVLSASTVSERGPDLRFEIAVAPLTAPSGEPTRVFGLFQPTTSLRRLRGALPQELSLDGTSLEVEGPRQSLRLVALNGLRVA